MIFSSKFILFWQFLKLQETSKISIFVFNFEICKKKIHFVAIFRDTLRNFTTLPGRSDPGVTANPKFVNVTFVTFFIIFCYFFVFLGFWQHRVRNWPFLSLFLRLLFVFSLSLQIIIIGRQKKKNLFKINLVKFFCYLGCSKYFLFERSRSALTYYTKCIFLLINSSKPHFFNQNFLKCSIFDGNCIFSRKSKIFYKNRRTFAQNGNYEKI